ncbi:hypothetical protein E2C01_010164 [Portunus trituberculatus]|uniref:Uncharacterized protein n=1 Tax=Portunus trituberculatus TaxID=210409 RepID=A0A5B7D7W7_PORTR|nr:hypothetical protein [Portunus trituberculatus]
MLTVNVEKSLCETNLSSGCPVDCEEEERLEPILDLEEALEEALGDLDSVGSMEVDANLRLTSSGSTSSSLVCQSETTTTDDPTGPPPAKRQRGRPRKQSFTGTPLKNEKSEAGKSGEAKEDKSSDDEEEFLGFSPSTDKDPPKQRCLWHFASASWGDLRREKKNSPYNVGDRVLARWSADGKRYQARVTKELGDGRKGRLRNHVTLRQSEMMIAHTLRLFGFHISTHPINPSLPGSRADE